MGLAVEVVPAPLPRLRKSIRFAADWMQGARSLAAHAREAGAAVIVANTVRAAVYASLAARLAGIPFIWYVRDFWLSEAKPRNLTPDRFGKALLGFAALRVIANSRAVAAGLPKGSNVRVVHNGIAVSNFDPALDGSAFRREYDIPASGTVVGMAGRLRPWKGQDRFLQAAARLRRSIPDAWFVLVGGTPLGPQDGYPEELRRQAEELGIAEKVIFTGQVEDVSPALAAMDVFVHPGDPEPFGLVNLEAMAMGLPVVAFAHGALPEIVLDRQTGILVPPGDLQALAEAIELLSRDRDLRVKLGQQGRQRVVSEFRIEKTARAVEAVLEEILR
jgi:glycosyltransferase involved in cell wall biosynthesis